MGKPSRDKGKRGEREVVQLARENGHPDAERAWQTPQLDGDVGGIQRVHLEVRFREGVSVHAWTKEVEAKARNGNLPVMAWRKPGERPADTWHASLPLDRLLQLLCSDST